MGYIRIFAIVLVGLWASEAYADAPRSIVWDDLLPKGQPLVDPLAHLAVNQRIELRLIAAARERRERGFADDVYRGKIAEKNLTRKLRDQGLDVEDLLAQQHDFKSKVLERSYMVDEALDAQIVRLSGYALPLEFSGTEITEFLLVPFVGACIHVPPPPPNQIVFVRTQRPFETDELYTPVWVTGRMSIEKATKSLSLVDGTAPVPSAYTMDAVLIEINR